MAIRTFLALDIDNQTRSRLAELQRHLDDGQSKIKWVQPDQLHVTLKFLGDVSDDKIVGLCAAAAEIAGGVQPFEFQIRGAVCVPPKGQLKMIWVGVDDPTGRMAKLHSRLEQALSRQGFREENRAFKPHITLARIKFTKDPDALRSAAQPYAEVEFGTIQADELVVYESRLTPAGPIYTPQARAPLGG